MVRQTEIGDKFWALSQIFSMRISVISLDFYSRSGS